MTMDDYGWSWMICFALVLWWFANSHDVETAELLVPGAVTFPMQLHLACRGPKAPKASICRKCCIWWMVANTVCTHIKPVSCRHDLCLCLCLGCRRPRHLRHHHRHHLRHHFHHFLRHILRHHRRHHHRHHHHHHHHHHHNHHHRRRRRRHHHHHHHHRPCHYHITMYLEHVFSHGSTIHFNKIWNLYT